MLNNMKTIGYVVKITFNNDASRSYYIYQNFHDSIHSSYNYHLVASFHDGTIFKEEKKAAMLKVNFINYILRNHFTEKIELETIKIYTEDNNKILTEKINDIDYVKQLLGGELL